MEELDRLAREFAERGYEPDGAELEGEQPAAPHGHEHEHGHEPAPEGGGHGGHGDSVRRFTHRGHEIEIVTAYQVTIDGKPWDGHLEVLPDGAVTYHGFPQYAVPSAVDVLRTVIDYEEAAPEELRSAIRAAREES